MTSPSTDTPTLCLRALSDGDRAAAERLFPMVYEELRALAGSFMKRESAGHTLQPTAVVHEAYLKLIDQERANWRDRAHFMAVAAQAIRRVLIDHARRRQAAKRGGDRCRLTLDEAIAPAATREVDFLAIDDALGRLAELHERQARVVELRFFGGLNIEEAAAVLGISRATVTDDWAVARAWLSRELADDPIT
jgi:RNA polymerase sigma factor (TIGR02999 family)